MLSSSATYTHNLTKLSSVENLRSSVGCSIRPLYLSGDLSLSVLPHKGVFIVGEWMSSTKKLYLFWSMVELRERTSPTWVESHEPWFVHFLRRLRGEPTFITDDRCLWLNSIDFAPFKIIFRWPLECLPSYPSTLSPVCSSDHTPGPSVLVLPFFSGVGPVDLVTTVMRPRTGEGELETLFQVPGFSVGKGRIRLRHFPPRPRPGNWRCLPPLCS